MTDPLPTATGTRALILVGTEPRSGLVLPLSTVLDAGSRGRLRDVVDGWTRHGWTDVHPAIEYLTYRRLTMAEAARFLLEQKPDPPATVTSGEAP